MEKLNQVPVFGIANGDEQLMAAPDPESGTPVITFHLDITEAQASLASIQAANPSAAMQLTTAPLGTAFEMSKQRTEDVIVRLQPSQAELDGVRKTLGFSKDEGFGDQPIPLFGSDELNFEIPQGPENPSGGEMTPLFFGVSDFRAAWAASGQPADRLPGLQLTDLRTLAYNMEHDTSKDWGPILLIAPEASIEFVKGQEEEAAPKGEEEEPKADVPDLTAEDVQALLFGDDSESAFGQKKTFGNY